MQILFGFSIHSPSVFLGKNNGNPNKIAIIPYYFAIIPYYFVLFCKKTVLFCYYSVLFFYLVGKTTFEIGFGGSES